MFDNLATALVQAMGFFAVFVFFVYQLLFDGKKPINTDLESKKKKLRESLEKNDKPYKKGLFGRKIEPVKEKLKPKKKGFFGKKVVSMDNSEIPNQIRWFK